jgi:D-erythronate 2-dehydrogenase
MTRQAAHVLVTGASGFVGRALVARLLREHHASIRPLSALTLLDTAFDFQPAHTMMRLVEGSIAEAATVASAFAKPVDVVYHLASIPGGMAEQHFELSRDVNLFGTLHLLEAARAQHLRGEVASRFVFASSVAVYGPPFPAQVDDASPLQPQMSYGAQKLMGELAVSDFSRRGWIDGLSLRLPGVLARPPAKTGQLSAFLSDIIGELAAGREFTCPTSAAATTWASSIHNVVDNLLHAADVDSALLPTNRALPLPTQWFTMGALVRAIAAVHGLQALERVRWAPDERIESLFGRLPPIVTPAAEQAGFRHDGDLPTLVRGSLMSH